MMNRRNVLKMALVAAPLAGYRAAEASPAGTLTRFVGRATTTAEYCADTEEQAFITLINNHRQLNGLAPLKTSQTLSAAADHHSQDMAAKNYFNHTLADGTTWDQNIRNHGYTFNTMMAENIAAGTQTASAAFTTWKGSAGHNANMLSASYTAIGIGRAYSSTSQYGWYWTTTFGGVQDAVAATCSTNVTPTPTPAPVQTVGVFVSSMAGSKTVAKNGSVSLSYKIYVQDTTGKVAANATVSLTVTTPKGTTQNLVVATSTKGVAIATLAATAGAGSYVCAVTGIVAVNKTYDPSKNKVSSFAVVV